MNKIKSFLLKVATIATAISSIAAGSLAFRNNARLDAQETANNDEHESLAFPSEFARTDSDYPFPVIYVGDVPIEIEDSSSMLYFDGSHLYGAVFWYGTGDSASAPRLTIYDEIAPEALNDSFAIDAENDSISFGSGFLENILYSEFARYVMQHAHFTSLFIDCGSLGETAIVTFETGFDNTYLFCDTFLSCSGIAIYAPRCDLKIKVEKKANVSFFGGLGCVFARNVEISGDGYISMLSADQTRWGGAQFGYGAYIHENATVSFLGVINAFTYPAAAISALNSLTIKDNAFISIYWDWSPSIEPSRVFESDDDRKTYTAKTSSIFSPMINIKDTSRVFIGFYLTHILYTNDCRPFEIASNVLPTWNLRGFCLDQAYWEKEQRAYTCLAYLPTASEKEEYERSSRFNEAVFPTTVGSSGYFTLDCDFGTDESSSGSYGCSHILYLVSGDSDVHFLNIETTLSDDVQVSPCIAFGLEVGLQFWDDVEGNIISRYFPSFPIPVIEGVPYLLCFSTWEQEYYEDGVYYEGCYSDSAMTNKVDDEIVLDSLSKRDVTLYAKYVCEYIAEVDKMWSLLYGDGEVTGECSANFAKAFHFAKYSMNWHCNKCFVENYPDLYLRFQNWAKANGYTVTYDGDGFLHVGTYSAGEDNSGLVSVTTTFNTTSSLPVILISSIAVTCSAFVIVVLSNKRRKKKENTK